MKILYLIINSPLISIIKHIYRTGVPNNLQIFRLFCILPKLVHFPMCQFVCSVQRMFVCLVSPRQKATARQKRDQKIASLLILIVTVFGCCNILRLELYHKSKKYFHDSVSMSQCLYFVCLCHHKTHFLVDWRLFV